MRERGVHGASLFFISALVDVYSVTSTDAYVVDWLACITIVCFANYSEQVLIEFVRDLEEKDPFYVAGVQPRLHGLWADTEPFR